MSEVEQAPQSTALSVAQERGLAAFDDGANPFTEYTGDKGVTNGTLMRFNGNTGEFSQNQQPIEHGTALCFDVFNAERGFIRWSNNRIVERIMQPFVGGQPLPRWDDLQHVKKEDKIKETDGWVEVIQIPVRDPEGGPAMDFSLPSGDAWRPVNRLVKEYGGKVRMMKDPEGGYKIPMIEVSSRSFDSKAGKKFAPVLTIVDWLSRADLEEMGLRYDESQKDASNEVAAPADGGAAQLSSPAPAVPINAAPAPQPAPAAQTATTTTPGARPGFRAGRVGQRA